MSFRKRLFAWLLYKGEKFNLKIYSSYKQELFKQIKGTVVEIGPGTGVNFNYMHSGTDWVGVEPNPAFHKLLAAQAAEHRIKARLVPGDAEHTALPDCFADTVLFTLVLCSVKNPAAALEEMKRILKPGGKLVFIEHVAAEKKSSLRFWQDFSNPVNRLMADGCNCNRETWTEIEKAGISTIRIEHIKVKSAMKLHSPYIIGYAVK